MDRNVNQKITLNLHLATLGVFLLSVASFAAIEGTCTEKASLPSSISRTGLESKLEFKLRREARDGMVYPTVLMLRST